MWRFLGVVLVLALTGCGADVKAPKESTAVDIRDRTLARVKALEEQAAKDEVKGKDVQALIVSVKYLIGHMKKEKVGTDEQLRDLTALSRQLMQRGGGPALPARDWRPDSGEAPPPPKIDAAPFKEVLPELREVLETIK